MTGDPFRTVRRDPGDGTSVPEDARFDAPGAWTCRSGALSRPSGRSSERAKTGIAWKTASRDSSLAGGKPNGECRLMLRRYWRR
jgi:hypothetical protein